MDAPNSTTKRCTKCGTEYPATPDHFNRNGHNRLSASCKACIAERKHSYYLTHKKEEAARKQRYKAKYPEREAEHHRHYYAEHKEERAAYNKRYRTEHKKEEAERQRRYHIEHPEKRAQRQQRYQSKNKEKGAERMRRHRAAHPEMSVAIKQRRRARELCLPDTFTSDEAIAALNWWQWKCAYCGINLAQLSLFNDIKRNFDHYIALSDKRPNNPGTVATNMLPSCAKCNESKCNRDPIQWIVWKFGKRKGAQIAARIQSYFSSRKAS